MFNGYNDSPLISYEFNQEREKKSDNASKYSYGHDGGVQSTSTHPNNRQSEFWSGKPNFIGISNVVKCNCTGCYPTTENHSYQVESTRHRPWLPKTFSVPLNGSNECKLPPYQWDSTLNQICYSDPNVPCGQENGGKHAYYRQFQTPNQPGVIISANKQKKDVGFQNDIKQPVMCNPGYDFTKRVNGRSYYDGDKYSLGAHSMNQTPRLPVEPYTKAVPSNLNQNRVPSMGQRKENSPQYDHYGGTKVYAENYHPGLSTMDLKNSGIHVDYSYFNRDPDFYRNSYTDIKRNNLAMQNLKDCAVTQGNLEQHYGRSKYPENLKGCEMFYPNLDKNQMESCIQKIESDGMNRLPRSVMVCNDLLYADERPQAYPYQNNMAYRNYVRPEYSHFNSQCVPGFQETDKNQCRTLPQQLQSFDQYPQSNNGCIVDLQKGNLDKTQSCDRSQLVDAQPKPNYLESIRSDELTKNGTNKISPLRLLRKKKFTTAPQELSSTTSTSETPMLDVRKFWSTWAEEDENVSPTQMVVLDCQNIDPEQAKLLDFYETDSSRAINLENVILKNPDFVKDNIENVKSSEQPVEDQEIQVENPTQMERVIKNTDEVLSELEAFNISPKKYRCQEYRKKRMDEVMDKWTEKKFDFLKRSEECKAAEIIKYEEKKKIFEQRLSFQQSLNKIEKQQDDALKYEENSQRNYPEERITSNLPTSEYRRNKFLDYSEVIANGCKDNLKIENKKANQSTEPVVKKEEPDVKHETDSTLEMNDILKKISEINFQEMKLESGLETSKNVKKTKKKKLDQRESDARTDLKLETASKPTIKFSIQKSHDLKISFKVLNKNYEEEVQSEEIKPIENVNTELITLKYKSIQSRDKLSDSKKRRGKLRRKKRTPVLKIKKSKKSTEEERDPLAEDDEAKTYPTDGFQVQETVDSAKIKLTFKRHKTNMETEYKVNNESLDAGFEEGEKNVEAMVNRYRKKSKKAKKHKIFPPVDIESSQLEPKSTEQDSIADCGSQCTYENRLESTKALLKKSISSSPCPIDEEEENQTTFGVISPEKRLCERSVPNDVMEDTKLDGEEQVDLIVNRDGVSGSNDQPDKFSSDENVGDAISKSSEKTKEEIQGISLDFIRSINSPDIETNGETEKTEGIEGRHATEGRNKNGGALIESTNENHSNLESSYDLKKNSDCLEMAEFGKSTSLVEVNASPKSDSCENFDADVTEKDENATENEIFVPEANWEEHSSSKPLEDNFEKHDLQQEKSKDFESEFGKNIESEIPKALDSKSEIEFEDIVIKIVEAEGSENEFKSSEESPKSESDVDRDCEQVDMIDTMNDEERSEFSEITPGSALPPNENMQQSKMGGVSPARLSEGDDKWVESNQTIIKEGDLSVELFGDKNSGNETKSDSESQSIQLRKFEDEESKSPVKDKGKDGKEGMFLMESELDNSTDFEKEDKFYDANKVSGDRFSCTTPTYRAESERTDDATNRRSVPSEKVSFTEEVNVDFGNHSVNENCYCGTVENVNEKVELINVENVPESSDIDHIADLIDEGSGNATEKDTEVIWDSKNASYNESATEVVCLSRTVEFDEELNRSDVTEKDEPEVGFNFSVSDSQNSSQVELKDYSQLAEVQQKGREADHFTPESLDSTRSGIVPDTCNGDDFLTCEDTRIDDARDSLDVVKHSEESEEKPDKEDEHFLNDKRTILMKAQENTITIENENRANGSSPVDLSRVNSTLTDPATIKSNDETDFVKNSSPRINEFEWNCLELASNQESELEDGEIIDGSSDESEHATQTSDVRKIVEFKVQKPIRRHSIYSHNTESPALNSWCHKRFVKSKSCPPRLELGSFELQAIVSVKDIPLPVGPAPLNSCFSPGEITQEVGEEVCEEAKEKPKQVSVVALTVNEKETAQELPCGSPFGEIELRNCRNPSPPHSDALGPHRSKIKFSLTKRSRFSKVGLHFIKPKIFEKPKLFKISEPVFKAPVKNMEPKVTEVAKKPEVLKNSEKPDLRVVEISKKSHVEIAAPEKIQQNIFKSAEKAETEAVEPTGTPKIGELFEWSESKAVELPEIVEPETYIENLKLEIIETDISISNQTNTHGNKIRTPDYVSERVEEISECQIAEVPNSHPTHADDKDQKSDPEVESLCEDANVEIVDVMDDFMRDKFYEDIPTSEDLPEGDSLDEKVNDDKFRNIMQNCLENAKKFLNVGNLKLFSCSVDDLLELDNQENEPAAKHISRDVLLTSCEDTNDDLGLNEKFQPVDISMEFIPSDVCPEILPVDNWPYLEEEVPSSPLKSNETDLILENTISEVLPSRKRAAKESDNHKRFRRKSLIDDEDTPYSKVAAHRRKTIDGSNSFLSYAELNGIDKPNESLKCRLSLDKLTKNGVEFIGPQSDFPKKMKSIQTNKKLNYKSSLWQPKVMLIRISESEMKRFKNTKIYGRFDEKVNSLPSVKKQKSDEANGKGMKNEVVLTIPAVDSIKGLITTSTDVKKHKPRFRNLHTKRKPDQGQSRPKAIETALSELFKDCDEESKNVKLEKTSRSMKNESKVKSDRHSSKHNSHDHEDRRRDSEREHHRHKEKHKHERSRHDEGKRHRNGNSDDDRRRSLSKNGDGQKKAKETWTCEVCGFNDASERVAHIKNHPFHCQSCHLAFKTEAYFTSHLTEMHKDIRNQHHCLLCELSFDTEEEYQRHLETREHTHLEAVEKNTINTLFTLLTGAPCPVLGLVEMKPEWLPNQSGTVHFYHQATPLSLALQYLKMHRDLTSHSEVSKVQPN